MGYYDQGEFYNFKGDFKKYIKKEGKKNYPTYSLKDGYETKFLGKGDNQSSMGALATYTNDYDDLWDSYDPNIDKSTYGIFKSASAAKAKPAPKPKPAPAPKPYSAITSPSNTTAAGKQYQSQIAALTASIKAQQQQQAAAAAAASQAAQKNYQSQLSKMQSLYASNLQSTKDQFGLQIKGLQTGYGKQIAGLQSSVSGLQTTISDNAAAYQQNIADQAAQFKAEQQTMMTNQERARLAGATPQLRLQEAQDMKQAGTKTFKKRIGSQFNPTAYGSLAAIKSGTLNI